MKKIFNVSIFLVVVLFVFSLAGAEKPPLPPPLPSIVLKKNIPVKKVVLQDHGGWYFEIMKYEEKDNGDGKWEAEGTRFLNLYFTRGVALNTHEVAPLHLVVNVWTYGKSEKVCQKWVIKGEKESYFEKVVEDKNNMILAREIIYFADDSTSALDSFRKSAAPLIKEKAEKEGVITERPADEQPPVATSDAFL